MLEVKTKAVVNFKKIFGEQKYNKWLKNYPILHNEDIQKWLNMMVSQYTNEGKSENKFTITSYLKPLQQYCIFNNAENPSELLKEDDIDLRNDRVKNFLIYLLNVEENDPKLEKMGFRGKPKESSIKNMIQSRIKSFYSNRGKPISFGMKTLKSGENKNELKITKDNMRQIQTRLGTINYKLISKFMSQTGLRIGDVLESLTNGKYIIEEYNEHYFIRNFKTFKEQVIINYLFFTEELSDHLKSAKGVNNIKDIDLTTLFMTKKGKRVSKIDFQNRLKAIVKQLNITQNIKSHGLRKYFSSQVRKCKKLDIEFKEHLMGHMGQNLSQAYNNNLQDIDWFFKQWKQIEQLVCVDCIVYDRTNKTIIKLETKIVTLEEQKEITIKENVKLIERIDGLESKFRILEEAIKSGLLKESFGGNINDFSPDDEIQGIEPKEIESKAGKEVAKFIIDKALDKNNK